MDLFLSPGGPEAVAVSLPDWVELLSVIVGSLYGIVVARERKLDLIGFIGMALLCGLGGGLLRDMAMQRGGVYLIDSPFAIPAATATAIVGFFFSRQLVRHPNLLEWLDILAVGLFAVMGTDKAMVFGLSVWACVLMGTLTGVGGGMLRDVFLGDVPKIFQSNYFYAICAIAGSLAYYVAVSAFSLYKLWAAVLCVCVTVALRRLSLRFNIVSPSRR